MFYLRLRNPEKSFVWVDFSSIPGPIHLIPELPRDSTVQLQRIGEVTAEIRAERQHRHTKSKLRQEQKDP